MADYGYVPIGTYLKKKFGTRVIKLAIDGGFTCPNRDGTKGVGGCVFCSEKGSGELASPLPEITRQIEMRAKKWPHSHYMAYFQSHTNTYGSPEHLRGLYQEAMAFPGMVGLAIATRPDCLGEETLDLLKELNSETFLWVELGLQTIHPSTAKNMNLQYTLQDFDQAIEALHQRKLLAVVHLILGLPGETREMMESSVDYVCSKKPFGIKLHMLNIVKGSPMEALYPGYQPFSCLEEYVELVTHLLKRIPPEITIHRLTGDVPRGLLLAPPWSYRKRTILNEVHKKIPQLLE
jgi:hypothetical protein